VAERIRSSVAGTPFPLEGSAQSIPITVSIGIAESPGVEIPAAFLKRADQALYLSKNSGRNRVTAAAA
jgi:two-component system cell cycle response regulator